MGDGLHILFIFLYFLYNKKLKKIDLNIKNNIFNTYTKYTLFI